MEKRYKLWDGIQGELIDVESPEDAKNILEDCYTIEDTAHPDIEDCILMEVLPHPLKDQLK